MLAASGIAIFLIPLTFYVVERLSSRRHSTAQATARATGHASRGGYRMMNFVEHL
jgi:hypothetical protein